MEFNLVLIFLALAWVVYAFGPLVRKLLNRASPETQGVVKAGIWAVALYPLFKVLTHKSPNDK